MNTYLKNDNFLVQRWLMSALPPTATGKRTFQIGGFGSMLSKKSVVARLGVCETDHVSLASGEYGCDRLADA